MSTEIVNEHAYISTNPLVSGVQNADGDIIVADAGKGLVKVESGGGTTLLTNSLSLDCSPVNEVVDMDIDGAGCIYFSDNDGLKGRLLKHDPSTGQTTVLLQGIAFATGVCLDHTDGLFVLVAESLKCRVIRLWLNGKDAGTHDLFSGHLPGLPGMIAPSVRFNGFWVALKALPQRAGQKSWVGGIENLNKLIFGGTTSPLAVKPTTKGPQKTSTIALLNYEGESVQHLQDAGVSGMGDVKALAEHGERLYFAGGGDFVGAIDAALLL
jgi:hypothetical protein